MKRSPADDSTLRKTLGLNLRLYRVRRSLSQRQLAALVGTSANRIGAIEKGLSSTTVDVIERLADALETEPWRLLAPDQG
tara:strand:+ start:16113 stop:16352 length:240 start_codon:yes stop_codon:yes gene_type:complete